MLVYLLALTEPVTAAALKVLSRYPPLCGPGAAAPLAWQPPDHGRKASGRKRPFKTAGSCRSNSPLWAQADIQVKLP